mmetsp:Transcript_56854/g.165060  ORF Transcript_56854/g.165060 Transcript_56854/m.165060 type:complete len:230 (-) Transcript_56854:1422-2111(-)
MHDSPRTRSNTRPQSTLALLPGLPAALAAPAVLRAPGGGARALGHVPRRRVRKGLAILLGMGAVPIRDAVLPPDEHQIRAPVGAGRTLRQLLPIPIWRLVLADIVTIRAEHEERCPVHVTLESQASGLLPCGRGHDVHKLVEIHVRRYYGFQLCANIANEVVDLLLRQQAGLDVTHDRLYLVNADRSAAIAVESVEGIPQVQLRPAQLRVERASDELLQVHCAGAVPVQ